MNAIQRFIFNLFLFCFGFGLLFFVKLDSFALTQANIEYQAAEYINTSYSKINISFDYDSSVRRFALLKVDGNWVSGNSPYGYRLYSNLSDSFSYNRYSYGYNWTTHERESWRDSNGTSNLFISAYKVSDNFYCNSSNNYSGNSCDFYSMVPMVTNIRIFSDFDDLREYITNGTLPTVEFDETLELDSFKVTSWSIGNLQALFKSKFDVTWSDPRISVVQVRITGTANEASYEGSSSPFKGKFQASQFVFQKGDVIHLVATPYKADGSYGTSLYYSVIYSDDIPFSNTYRKYVNTNTNDNTLTIPYTGTSGNDTVTLPVDGVTTNVTYKVNYNPVTNEYGDTNIYEIYYSPVVVYPDNTSDQEVDDTQDTIINNYNTTNYYETTKNINLNFDIDFGDISTNDIGEGFNGVSGFFNGFGGFIGRLSNWILVLFPFLPPIVATTIVFMFGLVIFIAGIALILKIIGAVGNIIDAILPL